MKHGELMRSKLVEGYACVRRRRNGSRRAGGDTEPELVRIISARHEHTLAELTAIHRALKEQSVDRFPENEVRSYGRVCPQETRPEVRTSQTKSRLRRPAPSA